MTDTVAEEKLKWEVRKLQAEAELLEKPVWKQMAFWSTVGTLVLLLVGAIGQWISASIHAERAELRAEKAAFEQVKTEQRLEETRKELDRKVQALRLAEIELKAHAHLLASVRIEVDKVRSYKGQLTADLSRLVESAQRSLSHVSSGILWGQADLADVSSPASAKSNPKK